MWPFTISQGWPVCQKALAEWGKFSAQVTDGTEATAEGDGVTGAVGRLHATAVPFEFFYGEQVCYLCNSISPSAPPSRWFEKAKSPEHTSWGSLDGGVRGDSHAVPHACLRFKMFPKQAWGSGCPQPRGTECPSSKWIMQRGCWRAHVTARPAQKKSPRRVGDRDVIKTQAAASASPPCGPGTAPSALAPACRSPAPLRAPHGRGSLGTCSTHNTVQTQTRAPSFLVSYFSGCRDLSRNPWPPSPRV